MEISAVSVSATDLRRAVAFYELLGFTFPPVEDGEQHVETAPGRGAQLMIDSVEMLTELLGEAPRPGTGSAFAVRCADPAEVDAVAARVATAGHTVLMEPWDAPWGQRYATVADPDGYAVDLYAPSSPTD
ncbi:glyoxalase [Modestobacter muralis]|uniref:Glyoxalase n=1 Tax=Modestobacter muralis TaxID=1608614 RepID=A0A6P0ETB5_9ACTN|nr:VOC family protein [Modestobacter muralis]NEK94991.1 glyoxalase [Modestobacter muralis]NEN51879.1 glyoxalase [Modestobacter muralis]